MQAWTALHGVVSNTCVMCAYTAVVTHLALGSLLCRLMLVKVVISHSGNSNGSCPKVVHVKARALHA